MIKLEKVQNQEHQLEAHNDKPQDFRTESWGKADKESQKNSNQVEMRKVKDQVNSSLVETFNQHA